MAAGKAVVHTYDGAQQDLSPHRDNQGMLVNNVVGVSMPAQCCLRKRTTCSLQPGHVSFATAVAMSTVSHPAMEKSKFRTHLCELEHLKTPVVRMYLRMCTSGEQSSSLACNRHAIGNLPDSFAWAHTSN